MNPMIYPTVYIVDDDSSVRSSLKHLMKSAGYSAYAFESAQSFLDSVPSDSAGCLILDIRMPEMNGFELQEKLRELHYHLHSIFITAHACEGDRKYAMDHGAIGFLQKPFNDLSLFELINAGAEKDKENER